MKKNVDKNHDNYNVKRTLFEGKAKYYFVKKNLFNYGISLRQNKAKSFFSITANKNEIKKTRMYQRII